MIPPTSDSSRTFRIQQHRFVIILDAKGFRRYQVGMATCYTVALVLKPARMVVNHYCVLALVKQGRATQRKGPQYGHE